MTPEIDEYPDELIFFFWRVTVFHFCDIFEACLDESACFCKDSCSWAYVIVILGVDKLCVD